MAEVNMEVGLLGEVKMEAVLPSETIMEETSMVKVSQGAVPLTVALQEEDHQVVKILKRRTKMGNRPNYLRGFTPGNTRYMDFMQNRYAQRIWEQVGLLTGQVGPEVKAMNLPKPGKYGGQDDLDKFDDWLGQILKYFHTFKVPGPDHDEDCILYTGLYLEGLASQWDKNKAAVKPWLYAVEVQEEEGQDTLMKEQSEEPDEEKITGGNHEHKETSDHKEGSQYDEGSLIKEYEVYSEVDDDDEPVAYFGAMREEDRSTTSKEVVSCAMMHVIYEDEGSSEEEHCSKSGSDTLEVNEESSHEDEP
ncbi:hypothetical protein PISMIDRAFT_18349 [Pisolithus microcarpus 441]|uniref:Uncharacterized protein n=1 Tax=Pisolithus microcarpus 441 TaxID=765257 RepID=A0A0C9YRK5_9AGAM|nr:hypothetical protein PISMIDRAFT_18349 [Pisolithus microcarpus 441]